jgi:N-formylglutamate deformylase
VIPPEERKHLLPDDLTLSQELLRMTDAWTDCVVQGHQRSATRVMFPVSRLVVDVERFSEDADEPMAARGMGAVYTRLSTGEPLRHLDSVERARLMRKYYYPHHATLTEAVDAALSTSDSCLILDIHSFSSRPLPHEPDQHPDRPEICIGIDPHHSPFESELKAIRICEKLGFWAEVNQPFSGSIVPSKHWTRTTAVRSVMIEVRRNLYMSEAAGIPSPELHSVASRICQMIEAFAQP